MCLSHSLLWQGKGWIPCSPEWGYIGVTQLSLPGIKERYALEYLEYKEGTREPRKLYTVWDNMGGMDRLTFKIIHDQLTSRAAYDIEEFYRPCLLYTSPSPRDRTRSRMPSSA